MINIKNNRELFVDEYLVDTEKTTARISPCKPVKREVAFSFDASWETHGTVYQNIVRKPNGTYLMYYKSNYIDEKPDKSFGIIRRICVLQSEDGLNWSRPELCITPLPGPRAVEPTNNIISDLYDYYDNMFVFYDTNPKCPENERYKAIYGEWGTGIFGYKSADGINFNFHPESNGTGTRESTLLISGADAGCYFDSLNTVYFNNEIGKYVAFVRGFHVGEDNYPPDPDVPEAVRDIRYMESEDFVHWSYPVAFKYNDDYDYQLYANAILPYYRADGLWVATPTRYVAWPEWIDTFNKMPDVEDRAHRGRGLSLNDAIFMSSRDCKNWYRFGEAILTPGPEQKRNWIYGDCYPCIGFVETKSDVPGADPYLSMYCKEDQVGKYTQLYRYSLRVDGFVEVRSGFEPTKLVTKPFVYEGSEMEINFSTSAIGWLKIKLISDGKTLETREIIGDKIDRIVGFENGTPADLSGKEVTMEIELCDAAIYSFKFN